jgi:prepilin-type N-terminal cleavage/methylation domain-containing protein
MVATARQKREAGEQGFTLVELLIVVVVLGVLAGVVVFALSGVSAQAAVAACNADATSVQTAVAAYNTENPTGTATAALLTNTPPVAGAITYLHAMPSSPDYTITLVGGAVYVAAPSTATAVPYSSTACSGAGAGAGGGGDEDAALQAVATTTTTAAAPATTTTTAAAPTTTTTAAPTTTTTTAPVSSGVTATPTTNTYGGYGGQDILAVSNTKSITALTITIKVAQTTGVTPNGGYNSFPGGISTTTYGTGSGSGTLTSTYVLNSGQSIPAGSPSGSFAAQYGGTGSTRVQTGDTWTVVSTSNGATSTLSGHV